MDYLKEFLLLEEKHHMFDAEILGVKYWMFLRKWIYNDLLRAKEDMKNISIRHEHVKESKVYAGLQLFYHSFLHPYKFPAETDVLISSHPRRVLEGDEYVCTYTTPIALELENVLVLERPDPYLHKTPVPEKYLLYVDRSILSSNIAYLWLKKIRKHKAAALQGEIKKKIAPFFRELNEIFGLELKAESYPGETLRHSVLYASKRRYFDKLLRRTKPKIILEVVSYLPENMVLNELAAKYGIPTVELQHGTISKKNISYTFSEGRIMPQLPDYFFAFSEFWKGCVPDTIPREKIKVVGFPYFESEVKRALAKAEPKTGRTIILLSQWSIGDKLSRLAIGLSERLGSGWKIQFKLHPAELHDWESAYPGLAGSGVEVLGEKSPSLYELFAGADIQIGVASTALYEGLGFGLKTYIYEILEKNVYYALCDMGYAEKFPDIESLVTRLENLKNDLREDEAMKTEFWPKDSRNKMLGEIRAVMEQEAGRREQL